MNVLKWIKKYIKYIILAFVLFCFLIPCCIHILFTIPAPISFFSSQWSAGDVLAFYGCILSFLSTTLLGIIACYQNKKLTQLNERANKVNEDMAKLQLINCKSYAKIDIDEISIKEENNTFFITLKFVPLNNIPIVNIQVKGCYEIKRNEGWEKIGEGYEKEIEDTGLVYITKPDAIIWDNSFDCIGNEISITLCSNYVDYRIKMFCFTLLINNIYGYETKQLFNVMTVSDKFRAYNTIEK